MTQFVRLAEDRLARILAVNRDLACEVDLERLLSRVTDQAIDLLGADRGFVLLADDADPSQPFSVIVRETRPATGTAEDLVRTLGGRVLRELGIVGGFAARVPGSAVPSLTSSPTVWRVWLR